MMNTDPCWRSECRNGCYYPEVCDRPTPTCTHDRRAEPAPTCDPPPKDRTDMDISDTLAPGYGPLPF